MLMNPELQGILPDVHEQAQPSKPIPTRASTYQPSTSLRHTRCLMTLLPVPIYCAVEAVFGIENVQALWALLLSPLGMLWYAVDYFLHNGRVRHVLKQAGFYGLFLTPAVTLFVAGLQPAGSGWPLAKVMLLTGASTCCTLMALVLWRDRKVARK